MKRRHKEWMEVDKDKMLEYARDLRSDLKYAFENDEGQTPNHKDVMVMDWLIEKVKQYEKDIEELEESLHIARVGRRDLTAYVKQLKNMFDITEIQYLRGLIMNDQFVNLYQKQGEKALIAQNKTMWEFTQEILKKLDELEGV
jgi:phosphoglucomutase